MRPYLLGSMNNPTIFHGGNVTCSQEAGSGARAIVGGHDVEVGTWEWVHRNSIKKKVEKTPLPAALLTALVPGHTRVYVSVDGQLAGALEVWLTIMHFTNLYLCSPK